MAHKVIVPPKKNYIPQFLKQRDINSYYVCYSTLLYLPLLRSHCICGCSDQGVNVFCFIFIYALMFHFTYIEHVFYDLNVPFLFSGCFVYMLYFSSVIKSLLLAFFMVYIWCYHLCYHWLSSLFIIIPPTFFSLFSVDMNALHSCSAYDMNFLHRIEDGSAHKSITLVHYKCNQNTKMCVYWIKNSRLEINLLT